MLKNQQASWEQAMEDKAEDNTKEEKKNTP